MSLNRKRIWWQPVWMNDGTISIKTKLTAKPISVPSSFTIVFNSCWGMLKTGMRNCLETGNVDTMTGVLVFLSLLVGSSVESCLDYIHYAPLARRRLGTLLTKYLNLSLHKDREPNTVTFSALFYIHSFILSQILTLWPILYTNLCLCLPKVCFQMVALLP